MKTTDGYLLRVFCIGFTKRQPNQIKKTSYAKSSQCRSIRRRMVEIITREISQIDLKISCKFCTLYCSVEKVEQFSIFLCAFD